MVVTGFSSAQAWEVTAGVTHSDVGLYDTRGGAVLGVGHNVLSNPGPLDLNIALEYVQRSGVQPRYFSHPIDGLTLDNAEVQLHYLQMAAMVGYSLDVSQFQVRPYGGFSLAIKLSEDWEQPEGDTNGEIGYEETDVLAHVGLSLHHGRYFLDGRYSHGLTGQVIDNTAAGATKAAESDDGLGDFEEGNKIWGFQLSLGYQF